MKEWPLPVTASGSCSSASSLFILVKPITPKLCDADRHCKLSACVQNIGWPGQHCSLWMSCSGRNHRHTPRARAPRPSGKAPARTLPRQPVVGSIGRGESSPGPPHHTPHFPASNLTDKITRFIGLGKHVQDSAAVSVLAPRQIPGRDAVTGESIRPWTCSSVMGREWLKHLGQASTAPSPGFTLLRLTLSLHRAASSPWLPPGCPTCSPPCSSRWLLPPPSSSDCGCGTVLA